MKLFFDIQREFTMKKFILLLLFVFAFSTVFSQVTPEYKETLRKYFKATNSDEVFDVTIKQMISSLKKTYTEIPAKHWDLMEEEFLKSGKEELVDLIAPIYIKYFTKEDLDKIIEFYNTPIGKKLAEKTPAITQESMKVGQKWGMKLSQRLLDRIKEQNKK